MEGDDDPEILLDDDTEEIFRHIMDGDLEAVQQCVLAHPEQLRHKESSTYSTPLIFAVRMRQSTIALWLIEHLEQDDRTEVSSDIDDDCRTALHHAARTNQLSVVQALVAAGGNPESLDDEEWPPLWHAVDKGHTEVVEFLLQLPDVQRSVAEADHDDDWTALAQASTCGVSSVVQSLLDAGADPTIPFNEKSPLNLAIEAGHAAVADLLRAAITKFELPRTPLRYAPSSMPP